MDDLVVFTALNHSGSFGKNFVKFTKNKYVIYWLTVGPYGEKLWPRSWKRFQDLGHSFSPFGPPSWQITYTLFYSTAKAIWSNLFMSSPSIYTELIL